MPKAREGDVNAFIAKFTGFGFNDLCSLPNLKQDTIMSNLKKRFVGEIVYTYVGDIVVSTNPFKDVSRRLGCRRHRRRPAAANHEPRRTLHEPRQTLQRRPVFCAKC